MSRRESYQFIEPHPSVPSSHYIYSGRGGAGNHKRYNPSDLTPSQTASGPASRAPLASRSPPAYYTSGRGGAGNLHKAGERAMFSFDEELERQSRMMDQSAPVYHIGRGGAGNSVDEMKPGSGVRKGSGGSNASRASADSNASAGSKARRSLDGMWAKVSRTLSRS